MEHGGGGGDDGAAAGAGPHLLTIPAELSPHGLIEWLGKPQNVVTVLAVAVTVRVTVGVVRCDHTGGVWCGAVVRRYCRPARRQLWLRWWPAGEVAVRPALDIMGGAGVLWPQPSCLWPGRAGTAAAPARPPSPAAATQHHHTGQPQPARPATPAGPPHHSTAVQWSTAALQCGCHLQCYSAAVAGWTGRGELCSWTALRSCGGCGMLDC